MSIDLGNLNSYSSEALQVLVDQLNTLLANRETNEYSVTWSSLVEALQEYVRSNSIELQVQHESQVEEGKIEVNTYYISDDIEISTDKPGLIVLKDYLPIATKEEAVDPEEDIDDEENVTDNDNGLDEDFGVDDEPEYEESDEEDPDDGEIEFE